MALTIGNFAGQVRTGEPQTSGRLIIYPLFSAMVKTGVDQQLLFDQKLETHEPLTYLLLEDALDLGSFKIDEISESGSVNTVIITNMTGMPVLILDGEEIIGAKQNRMVNATILVAADKATEIPVSCVERGRWRHDTDKFGKSDAFGYSTLRRQKAAQVQFSLQEEQEL